MVFLFPQGPEQAHKRVDGLGFVSEDIVGEWLWPERKQIFWPDKQTPWG